MIYIDLGNGETKIWGEDNKYHSFRSTVVYNRHLYQQTDNVYAVECEGVNMVIGAADGNTFPGSRRYDREEYLMCLLTAIAIGSNGKKMIQADIKLNLPIMLYQNEDFYNKLACFTKIRNKSITINGETYNITINSVQPLPEGMVLQVLEENKFKNKRNLFIDLGYETVDIMAAMDSTIELIETIDFGINKLYKHIANLLNCPFSTVEYYFRDTKNAVINYSEYDFSEEKTAAVKWYSAEIIEKLEDLINLSSVNAVYLIGGGAEICFRDLKKMLKNQVHKMPNPSFQNVDIFQVLE